MLTPHSFEKALSAFGPWKAFAMATEQDSVSAYSGQFRPRDSGARHLARGMIGIVSSGAIRSGLPR
ncbi:hypothetical protein B0T26DRAFT_724305 [Lasiosphaeria miniovina]|uniref:Uncharacterized protein n=1 Tax=Lasiosphaeria miniovina TaxID=1954250 RepID=A0AA40A6R8_9PEZI|nr:uncharacterized protein B0T26DRAFT_724305 [Lasiosphaeria miniovina]KAK0710191.1 hypothetical protein B0T26DRAFT_724305 [Lasiosphaeria miniovina]